MRNEIFSFPRFAQLARYEVLTRRKNLATSRSAAMPDCLQPI